MAFTIYLKVPNNKSDELRKIESYIEENRKKVLSNKRTTRKVRLASWMSCISFKLVRTIFVLTNVRKRK